jgi:hypothetical protein
MVVTIRTARRRISARDGDPTEPDLSGPFRTAQSRR